MIKILQPRKMKLPWSAETVIKIEVSPIPIDIGQYFPLTFYSLCSIFIIGYQGHTCFVTN